MGTKVLHLINDLLLLLALLIPGCQYKGGNRDLYPFQPSGKSPPMEIGI